MNLIKKFLIYISITGFIFCTVVLASNAAAPVQAPVNFETKKAEIVDVLELSEKQQVKAEKIYTKAKAKIVVLNNEINNKHKEAQMVKLSKIDTRTQLSRLIKLNEELDVLYHKRDKIHNSSLKKFDKILNKKQLKTWQDIKIRGARLFPPIDNIKEDIENPASVY